MRRTILTSLVLLPLLANVQANAASEPKPSTSSVALQAELRSPAGMAEVAMAAAAETPSSLVSTGATAHAAIRESVKTQFMGNFAEAAMKMGGTLEYSMKGSAPTEASAAKVTRAVEVDLSEQELLAQPAVSSVVVHAIVDEQGIPRNVGISHSAGKVVDDKAIAAVSQYRFKPATLDNQPTWSEVSISIKIQKQ
jgi:TonB family protein